ncbi:NAD(P)/FAD-dependent oxidoreductase [Xanthobacter aminoxidans]|uniref:NAD(P)/FAD-dependent oxidoreductase n=1 Tax=Xanthobacter aminoxidans TaxID=186280 RepID=UPI00372A238A
MLQAKVLVLGGGLAACAAAITLAQSDVEVAVVHLPASSGVELPESLMPAALPLLAHLGIDIEKVNQQFPRLTSRLSKWGRAPIRHDDMRPRFDAPILLGKAKFQSLLMTRLRTLGCTVREIDRIDSAIEVANSVRVTARSSDGTGLLEFAGEAAIDATGRASALAHSLGVRRRIFDSLVSFWIFGETGGVLNQATVTATVHDGWIFCAGSGDGRAAIGFFTAGAHLASKPNAMAIVERASAILELGEIIEAFPGWAESKVITRNAATTLLNVAGGLRWLACGDSLQTIDPLASRGNFTALRQGILAAECAKGALRDDHSLMASYAWAARREFVETLRHRQGYYGLVV